MRTRERARSIFLWDIAAEIQGALTGRKRWVDEHAMECVLDVNRLEKGPVIT